MSQDHIKQNVADRPRRVNLDAMEGAQVDAISKAIGDKVAAEMNSCAEKLKKMLAIYGLEIKLTYIIHASGENPLDTLAKEQASLKSKQTKTRKPRAKKAKAG